jgi:AraC-like DNA-binding protein
MDVHIVPGVKARNVAEAHQQDLIHQEDYACKCMTYWVDEQRENVFCLIDAPSKEAVIEMHNKAHGLIPHKIIEVSSLLVESFLGRIYDPTEADITDGNLKVFHDPSFRVLLVTQTIDPVLLKHTLGKERSVELLQQHNDLVRQNIREHTGREVEHGGCGFIISFTAASKALSCALAIHRAIEDQLATSIGFKMSITAGEPVEKSATLFGSSIQKAGYMCAIAKCFQVALSSSVRELVTKENLHQMGDKLLAIPPQDEALLESLYATLEEKWQDPEFDADDFCHVMTMSKSQLYRKTIALTGISPNVLLKEFRLDKAREMMKKKHYNIAQVTFDSGFTSPSYFTKCFKKKFGLLPMSYIELVQ